MSHRHSLLSTVIVLVLAPAMAAAQPSSNPRARFDRMVEIAPAKGRQVVGAVAIDWCDHADTQYATGGALARVLGQMETSGWHWEHVPKAAALLCANPGDPDYQRQAGYFIQGLVNLTGQSPAQVVKDLKVRMAPRWRAAREETCGRFAASPESSAEQRAFVTAHRELFGCGSDEVPTWWLARPTISIDHHLDRTAAEPSQLLRAYHVFRCLSMTSSRPEAEVITYGMCSNDIGALDAKALEQELARDKHNEYAAAIARQTLSRARMRAAEVEARVRAFANQDPAYARLGFDVPKTAWQRALERHRAHAAALDRSAAYEAVFYGPSRNAAKGCATQLREDFRSYVRAMQPKDLDAVRVAATDDVGVLLLARLTACEGLDGSAHAAEMLYRLGVEARSARGARLAVYHALVDALGEIRADRERFPIEPGDLPSMPRMELWSDAYKAYAPGVLATQSSAGVVKRVTKTNNGVIVEFATESWTEDDWHCRDSNKIWKIDGGRVIYHQTCKKVGKRTVKRTAPTIWVSHAYAAKLAPGAFVEIDYDLKKLDTASIGIVRAVYHDKARTKLVAAYGVPLR